MFLEAEDNEKRSSLDSGKENRVMSVTVVYASSHATANATTVFANLIFRVYNNSWESLGERHI